MKYKNKTILFLCLLLTAVPGSAQRFRFGVRGGATLNPPTQGDPDESKRYLVGPILEMRWQRFAVETGFLYRRIGNGAAGIPLGSDVAITVTGPDGQPLRIEGSWPASSRRTRAHLFEIPVVGKYYFQRDSRWRPFLGTGFTFSKSRWKVEGVHPVVEGNRGVARPYEFDGTSDLNIGVILSGGVQYRYGRIGIAPEFRYTRWGNGSVPGYRKNQAELSVGFTF